MEGIAFDQTDVDVDAAEDVDADYDYEEDSFNLYFNLCVLFIFLLEEVVEHYGVFYFGASQKYLDFFVFY